MNASTSARIPLRWTVVVLLFLVLAGALWVHRAGLANARLCGTLEPGIPRSALVQMLGAPTGRQLNPAGTRLILFFRGPLFAARAIRVVVNVRDDIVMEVDCGAGRIKTYDKY